jgi:hypothetical protein
LVTYLNVVTPLVCSQFQADAIYFDLSGTSDLVPHTLLLHKLADYELAADYINWFSSYLTNRLSHVRYSGVLSLPFELLSGIP